MSLECGECEMDLRSGHHDDCSRHPSNRIARLESQLAKAITALEPFNISICEDYPNEKVLCVYDAELDQYLRIGVNVGDLRLASTTLAELQK